MSERVGNWMPTVSGRVWWPLDPRPEELDIEDLAHNLALLNRFPTSAQEPYTVAQHSVLVSFYSHPEDALWGLLHDAPEAVMGVDLPTPIKDVFPEWRQIERRIMDAVCERYGLPREEPESVVFADRLLLCAEAHDVVSPECDLSTWECLRGMSPRNIKITPWDFWESKQSFLTRFRELRSK